MTEAARSSATGSSSALSEPFALPEGEVILSASTGIALSTGTETAEELLHHADAALARAKRLGRSRAEIYDRDLRALALEQLRIEHDLRLALDRNELAVHFQPELVPGHRSDPRRRGAAALAPPRARPGGCPTSSSPSPRRPA